jgi:S-DNA-T family DNA segregation ATPase FtsK/SpoIIIE
MSAALDHGVPLASLSPVYIERGPTLVAVGIQLEQGKQLDPLRKRLPDIARDIGLGGLADQLILENDDRPQTARILLPNPCRTYPLLPASKLEASINGNYLPIWLGQEITGKDYLTSVMQWPHMLIAGTTGSGKTTFLKTILKQLADHGPERLDLAIVDGKGDMDFHGIVPPTMFLPEFPDVLLGCENAIDVLRYAEADLDRRMKITQNLRIRNQNSKKLSDDYYESIATGSEPACKPLVIVIDEYADIMLGAKDTAQEFENLIKRVAFTGRSRMIHLILSTQRPDKDTMPGAIKANIDARAILRLPTASDAITALGHGGAEKLLTHGDLLFKCGSGNPIRLQGYSL